ncbi:SMAP domain containing protein [Euroglyphus maynei]|uniref:SMAP domain containing protein n=1 Tax=Euroglyphus maynei TaxID=6958 RepID=A0A1Y3BDI9_EURMA|nr:SMAP domain containing protein [Euroglyphus maynei]
MTEKFRKLMGIKTTEETTSQQSSLPDDVKESSHHVSNQAKLFENLDQQYSIARRSTHLARGVGLGFTAAGISTSIQRNYDESDK